MNNAKLVITNREKAFKNIKTVNISILPPVTIQQYCS